MKLPSIYELTENLQRIQETIVALDGEVTDELAALFDVAADQLEERFQQACRMLANLDAEASTLKGTADAIQREADRYKAAVRARERAVQTLNRTMLQSMQRLGIAKVQAGPFSVRRQANSTPIVSIRDARAVPQTLYRVVYEFDREKALLYYREHGEVPGGVQIETGEHLRIS